MRKVKIKMYVKPSYNEGKRIEGTGCFTDFILEGVFHEWGSEVEDVEESVATYTVAIVELADGTIETPVPSSVKFI